MISKAQRAAKEAREGQEVGSTSAKQRTLLIVKPDAVERRLTGEIIRRLESACFRIVQMKVVHMTVMSAREFYAVHEGRPFFEGLVEYMSAGAAIPIVVEREGAVTGLRELVGKTDPKQAACGTLRHDFGLDVRRNSVHASDSVESAGAEIDFFFPKCDPG